jgi:hypothetical protein
MLELEVLPKINCRKKRYILSQSDLKRIPFSAPVTTRKVSNFDNRFLTWDYVPTEVFHLMQKLHAILKGIGNYNVGSFLICGNIRLQVQFCMSHGDNIVARLMISNVSSLMDDVCPSN